MKILSKILIDAYYDLQTKDRVPFVMQWDMVQPDFVGVSTSKGKLLMSTDVLPRANSGVFPVQDWKQDVFGGIAADVLKRIKPKKSKKSHLVLLKNAANEITASKMTPKHLVGPTKLLDSATVKWLKDEDIQQIAYPLPNCFMLLPKQEELGFWILFSKIDLNKLYATYYIRNPLGLMRVIPA